MQQITDSVLMIRPSSFRSNEETAVNNYFQKEGKDSSINDLANKEFDDFVELLRNHNVEVIVSDSDPDKDTPDALFPNNWISFHESNHAVIYPMYAKNRRRERDLKILEYGAFSNDSKWKITDYTDYENEGLILEGTGSMVLDRVNRKAYCAISPRSNLKLLNKFCDDIGFTSIPFYAYQTYQGRRALIYHTNVLLSIGEQQAIICSESIDNLRERKTVVDALIKDGKEIIEISESQVAQFAGNMLQLKNKLGERLLIMSQTAFDSLDEEQLNKIKSSNKIVKVKIPTIEKFGGGSARCMLAEIF